MKTTNLTIMLIANMLAWFVVGNNDALAQILPAPTSCSGLAAIPPNKIHKYEPNGMMNLIRQGCPPPRAWRKAVNHELIAGGGANAFSAAARCPAHNDCLGYNAKGACKDLNQTKAGGLSDDGAKDSCNTGVGWNWFSIPISIPRVPEVTNDQVECLNNLVELFLSGQPPNVDADVDLDNGGACAAGSVRSAVAGQCGADSRSGSVCVTENNPTTGLNSAETASIPAVLPMTVPFGRVLNPKYVVVNSPYPINYINNDINKMTGIYLPNGGTVTHNGATYNLTDNSFVTMNDLGQVYFGPNSCAGSSGSDGTGVGCYIELQPDEYVSIDPNGGVVNVDEAIFQGETLNVPSNYLNYDVSDSLNNDDVRNTGAINYESRTNVITDGSQIGPGPENCISSGMVDLIGLSQAQDTCVGAQRAGLSDSVLDPNGNPSFNCPPSVSLLCQESPNQIYNNNIPSAPQQQ